MSIQQILGHEPAPREGRFSGTRWLAAALMFCLTVAVSVSLAKHEQPDQTASQRTARGFHEARGSRAQQVKPAPGVIVF